MTTNNQPEIDALKARIASLEGINKVLREDFYIDYTCLEYNQDAIVSRPGIEWLLREIRIRHQRMDINTKQSRIEHLKSINDNLQAENDALRQKLHTSSTMNTPEEMQELRSTFHEIGNIALEQENERLKARIAELEKALKLIQRRNYPPNFAEPYPSVLDSYAIATEALKPPTEQEQS